jgi:hypothetical protein
MSVKVTPNGGTPCWTGRGPARAQLSSSARAASRSPIRQAFSCLS